MVHLPCPPQDPQMCLCPKYDIPLPLQLEHLPVPPHGPHFIGCCVGVCTGMGVDADVFPDDFLFSLLFVSSCRPPFSLSAAGVSALSPTLPSSGASVGLKSLVTVAHLVLKFPSDVIAFFFLLFTIM